MENRKAKILAKLALLNNKKAKKYLADFTYSLMADIKKSNSNDLIFDNLKLLEEYVYRVPVQVLEIVKIILSRKPISSKIIHRFKDSNLYGKETKDIYVQSIELLDKIRYIKIKETLDLLLKFYALDNTLESTIIKVVERLSRYDLFVLRKIGYYPQSKIIEQMEGWDKEKITAFFPILIAAAKEMISPSFEGSSSKDYMTLELHFGALKVIEELVKIRTRAIDLLKRSYKTTTSLAHKNKVIQTLHEATQPPRQGNYGEDMEQMIINDTDSIIKFYLEILPTAENEVVQSIEQQKNWFIKRFGVTKLPLVENLEEAITSHPNYSIFRVFVGYDGRLNPEYDYELDKTFRTNKVDEFVSAITEKNLSEWRSKILSIVKNYPGSDGGAYQYFGMFLEKLGEAKPNLALLLIANKLDEKTLHSFLTNLISGVWKSGSKNDARLKVEQWIRNNEYLEICALIPVYTRQIDISILEKVFKKAKFNKDTHALRNIILSIVENYSNNPSLKKLFIKTIKALTANQNTSWVWNVWYKDGSVLKDLKSTEFSVILSNLLHVPRIDFHVEEILKPIAEQYPEKIINFFFERVLLESKMERKLVDQNRYDSVPYEFYKLNEILAKHEKKIVPLIFKWYDNAKGKKAWLIRWQASKILENIFSTLAPGSTFEVTLEKLAKKPSKQNTDIVFAILRNYKGEDFVWRIAKTLVKTYAANKEYKHIENELFANLSQTGVVMGEYGIVDAYKKKKEEAQIYKNDLDDYFKEFVLNYEKYLDQSIAYHQKRTDEEVELRKLEFGPK